MQTPSEWCLGVVARCQDSPEGTLSNHTLVVKLLLGAGFDVFELRLNFLHGMRVECCTLWHVAAFCRAEKVNGSVGHNTSLNADIYQVFRCKYKASLLLVLCNESSCYSGNKFGYRGEMTAVCFNASLRSAHILIRLPLPKLCA